MKDRISIIALIFIAALFSCTKDVGTVNLGHYPDDIDNIMTTYCSLPSCHNAMSSGAANGLNLESWPALFAGSNSGSPVIPYSSRFSSLCYFINVYPELGTINQPLMPLNKSPMSKEQVVTIMDWIDNGAPDRDGNVFCSDPNLKKLYATNQGCDVVTVFDSKTQLPIRFVEVGPGHTIPHQVRVSPDGKYWYVIFLNNNVMKKFRCSDDKFVKDIPMTPLAAGIGSQNVVDWNTFAITADGKRAYCVSFSPIGFIAVVDLENEKFVTLKPAGNNPHGIALSADEKYIYVAAQLGNYITEIDTAFGNYTSYSIDNKPISDGTSLDPHDMLLTKDGRNLLITCQTSNELRVFSLDTKQTTDAYATGLFPQELSYSSKNKTYFVSCSGDGTPNYPGYITKYTPGIGVVTMKFGAQPHGLVCDDSKNLLYVLSRNISSNGPLPHHTSQCAGRNGFVNFIDLATFKTTKDKFELSVDPYFISIRP